MSNLSTVNTTLLSCGVESPFPLNPKNLSLDLNVTFNVRWAIKARFTCLLVILLNIRVMVVATTDLQVGIFVQPLHITS